MSDHGAETGNGNGNGNSDSPHAPLNESRGESPEDTRGGRFNGTRWLDVPGIVLFVIVLALQIAAAIVWQVQSEHKGGKNAASEDVAHAIAWLSIMWAQSLGWAIVFSIALKFIAKIFLLLVLVVLILGLPFIGYGLAQFEGVWGWAILFWVVPFILFIWALLQNKKLLKAPALLSSCWTPVMQSKGLFGIAFLMSIISLGYGFLVTCFTAGWRQGFDYTDIWEVPIGLIFIVASTNWFRMSMLCASSRVAAAAYWQNVVPTKKPALSAFACCWTKLLGSTTIAATIGPLWAVPLWILNKLIGPLFAFSHQAMYPMQYLRSTKYTLILLKNYKVPTSEVQIANRMITLASMLGGVAVGGLTGLLGPTNGPTYHGWVWFYTIGGFIVGTGTVSIWLTVFSGFGASTWYCYAESRATLKEKDPSLYSKITRLAGLNEELSDIESMQGPSSREQQSKSDVGGHEQISAYEPKHPLYSDTCYQSWESNILTHRTEATHQLTHVQQMLDEIDAKRGPYGVTPNVTPAVSNSMEKEDLLVGYPAPASHPDMSLMLG